MPSAVVEYRLTDFCQMTAIRQEIMPVHRFAAYRVASEIYSNNEENGKIRQPREEPELKQSAAHSEGLLVL